MIVLIDNGHGIETAGNMSPDGRIYEWSYTREIARMVALELMDHNITPVLVTPCNHNRPISQRVKDINKICKEAGAINCVLVSIHSNAVGRSWQKSSSGFSAFVSKNASTRSKQLATIFHSEAAADQRIKGNRSIAKDKDGLRYCTWSWKPSDIYILRNSKCPAVLTENLFMDNQEDVDYLLSMEGKQAIAKLHVNAILKYIEQYG